MKQKNWLVLAIIVLFFPLIFLLFGKVFSRDQSDNANDDISLPLLTPTIPSTKWWIKTTVTSPSAPLSIDNSMNPANGMASNCPSIFSTPLQPGVFAYISLTPPLPNRIRTGAGITNPYLGQIPPGTGVKIIDGPLCEDGFLWWLVESTQSGLRGWTAEGRKSEQWIIPCLNQTVACQKKPLSTATSAVPTDNGKTNDEKCRSEKLTTGIPAQVEQGSLLVIRSEPNNGEVVARAGPLSAVDIVDGPACAGGAIWFKVNFAALNLSGWATENSLHACQKDDRCN